MIQRIQTLYLLLVVALGVTLCFMPAVELYTLTPPNQVFTLGMVSNVPAVSGTWVLSLTTVLIPVLALADIFLFKKRILQARLNIFQVCLCAGYYAIIGTFVWFAKMNLNVDWHVTFWAAIPLICLVLTLMATRRILKDEALVRAADRLR
jgi:hypothetical protein